MGLIVLKVLAVFSLFALDYGFYISTDLHYWNTEYAKETIPAWIIFVVMNIVLLLTILVY